MRRNPVLFILAAVVVAFLTWLICPPISLGFGEYALFWLIMIFLLVWSLVPAGLWDEDVAVTICLVLLVLYFLYAITGWGLFRADSYYNQLGKPAEKEFTESIVPIDVNKLPIVDANLAKKLGDKRLGEEKALGSICELGEFTLQSVKGDLVWVAPLLHRGFFQWLDNQDGTPGYITVSATNPQDVKLVQELDGKKLFIKYQPNAYWGDDLQRHIWSNGFLTKGITDFTFEIDDSGQMYYTATTYRTEVSWGGNEATGTIVINAQTGELKAYSIQDTPKWVDRIQPKSFVTSQVANWGDYVHGYINLQDKDRLMIADGSANSDSDDESDSQAEDSNDGAILVYSNGTCYYFMGLTSVGKDQSTVGFMLVNSRTKEAFYYHMAGAFESSAMKSAEGKVQNFGYSASIPIPINLDGIPTYFMTLKDQEGLIKGYAMVNIQDYSLVGIGESLQEAKNNYKAALYSSGNSQALSQTALIKKTGGLVQRISSAVKSGNTYYYILLDSNPNQAFVAKVDLSLELPLTFVGDQVELSYIDSGNSEADIRAFDNLRINLKKTQEQIQVEQQAKEVQAKVDKGLTEEAKADKALEGLSEKDKAELLKKLQSQQ
ncbi:MAG: cell shape-determining protein [Ignavibacteriales bacterium]